MRTGLRIAAIALLALFLWSSPVFRSFAYAHPGGTASDGCHYCRTNCEQWGEVPNQRHCHGAPAPDPDPEPVQPVAPVQPPPPTQYIPPPTPPPPTPPPTPAPTEEPTPTQTEEPTPTDVLLEDEDDASADEAGNPILGFAILGAIGGGAWYLVRRRRSTPSGLEDGSPEPAPAEGLTCPSCAATAEVGARFCRECGASLS